MPTLDHHQASTAAKILLIGDSGVGKTGSLISLIEAGYRLIILDFDNGLDYLKNLAIQRCPDKLKNVHYITLSDGFKTTAAGIFPDPANVKAFMTAMKLLDRWKIDDEDLGPAKSWGPETVFVVDSLTFMGQATLRYAMLLAGKLNENPSQPIWGVAINRLEQFIGMACGDNIHCHVVMTAHVVYKENDAGAVIKMHPSALGRALPPKVASYFNSALKLERRGTGAAAVRCFLTASTAFLELKASSPAVPAELPIDTGLAHYIQLVTGQAKPSA